MLKVTLAHAAPTPLSILCLGAHADDIEIGCGGSVLTLLERHPGSHVHWVVFSASPQRAEEARASAHSVLAPASSRVVIVHGFRDSFFPSEYSSVKETMEGLKRSIDPHLIFTHRRADHHQDHRILSELTWNAFRNHLILEYEIPKYDPDLGNPNVLVPLLAEHAQAKVAGLMRHFESQRQRQWFDPDTFYGLMRLRGMQAGAPSGLAEGFYGHKLCL